jgi:hypothetical protein
MNAAQKTIMNANPFSGLFEMQVEAVVLGPGRVSRNCVSGKMRQEAHAPA